MIYMLILMITLFILQKLRLGINPIVIADCFYTGDVKSEEAVSNEKVQR